MPKYYFISDVHLGHGSRDEDAMREQRLLSLLDQIASEARGGDALGLYLVGDIFDSWFEFRSVIPRGHIRTLGALARIADLISVEYLMGNHDFGHRNFFPAILSIPVHSGDIKRTLLGTQFYIAHGDGKAANDTGYKILRAILRSRLMRLLYSILHPDIGLPIANYLSRTSRSYTDQRDALRKVDGLQDFARKVLSQHECTVVVMGHRHEPQLITTPDGIYANLGDWVKHYTFGVFDETGFHIEPAPDATTPSASSESQ